MSTSFLQGLQIVMSTAWRFAVEVKFPGTNITIGAMGLFLIFAPLVLNFFTKLIGVVGISQGNKISTERAKK